MKQPPEHKKLAQVDIAAKAESGKTLFFHLSKIIKNSSSFEPCRIEAYGHVTE